ncbi:polyprenyl synthetase family protein [Dyadobacter subterraneus]|uniref:Polyprenyl synthetase family protein n=1 Tax=Dyadobacter subterraneus TaxID=2773304 RepID=A0ABR9WJL6_9BACT|nr:polyprenyl synthetase family protein [Dyadobacter subterraneus]MBE9465702.1 polyprenyl synthetase family protein [Dyadobacter subterraneus]
MTTTENLLQTLQTEIEQTSYGESPAELYEPIRYIMALGGKRFRPLLTLLSASLYTDDWKNALRPAIAVEVFHNFTLMHDDIMDKAPLRRGKPTVHEKWNANTAILSGDVMLIRAYDFLIDIKKEDLRNVLVRFNQTAAEVCEGQQLDMNFETRWDVTEDEYLNMIRLKTSVLLGFALELGGIIGGADSEATKLLYEAGESMGIGFQLKDDLLDVYGDPEKFGKLVGGDIIANKKTFLLIEALTKAEGKTGEELNKWISAKTFDKKEKVAAVREIYDTLGIRALTEQKITDYFDQGIDCLERLPVDSERKKTLLGFVRQLVEREQ